MKNIISKFKKTVKNHILFTRKQGLLNIYTELNRCLQLRQVQHSSHKNSDRRISEEPNTQEGQVKIKVKVRDIKQKEKILISLSEKSTEGDQKVNNNSSDNQIKNDQKYSSLLTCKNHLTNSECSSRIISKTENLTSNNGSNWFYLKNQFYEKLERKDLKNLKLIKKEQPKKFYQDKFGDVFKNKRNTLIKDGVLTSTKMANLKHCKIKNHKIKDKDGQRYLKVELNKNEKLFDSRIQKLKELKNSENLLFSEPPNSVEGIFLNPRFIGLHFIKQSAINSKNKQEHKCYQKTQYKISTLQEISSNIIDQETKNHILHKNRVHIEKYENNRLACNSNNKKIETKITL
ncbi:hypothetical protein M0813_00387 [Anaeramoeba flamelloides]|uniref:Uncharacterized protein n=1 Tax=Anaeramoeba flamelloides TaxID=1746091 RepID=A0ABQ8YAU5_9EUKA|nr:hypothetical protein M0813_00387 [Anaeramoeba flamelloides]